MSRLVNAWSKAKPLAMETTSQGGCSWAPDGQSFSLTWLNIKGREINLEKLRRQVIREKEELNEKLVSLFPYIDFSEFLLSKVTDNAQDPTSLFDRPDNVAFFQPFIDQIWGHLGRDSASHPDLTPTTPIFTSTGQLRRKLAKQWLEGPRDILRCILRQFYRTTGIPPRAWQTSALLYRPWGSYLRNFRLLRHGTSFISHPKAKQRDRLMYEAFWAQAPHLGLSCIFVLGVVRKVEIELLKMLGIPTFDHEHYIFVHTNVTSHPDSFIFSTATINEILQTDTTPELAYEARAYRNVFQSIYDNHFARLHPDAVEKILRSAANEQAQHTDQQHDGFYALDEIAKGTGMPLSKRSRQFAVSNAFHSWFGFIPGDVDWSSYTNYRPSEDKEVHKLLALDTARRLVIKHYRITDGKVADRSQRVAKITTSKPYLLGSEVSHITNQNIRF